MFRAPLILAASLIPFLAAPAAGQRVPPSRLKAMLAAPAGVSAAATGSGVGITWQPAAGAAQYQVFRSSDPAVAGAPVGAPTSTTSTIDPAPLGTPAYYVVVSVAADGRQAASAPLAYAPPVQTLGRATNGATIRSTTSATATMAPGRATPTPPAGPPPVKLAVRSLNPALHQLTWDWDGVHGISYSQVYKHDQRTASWQLIQDHLSTWGYMDSSFIAPNTMYRVVALYPDGSQGSADITYPNPPQAQAPGGFTGVQASTGSMKLSWQSVPGAKGYRLSGPTLPPAGLLVGGTSQLVTGLPTGNVTFSITTEYNRGQLGPPASLATSVQATSGKYRVLVLGVVADRETADDPLEFDGKRDEIYVAAFWATFARNWGHTTGTGFVQTPVYGDVNRLPGRIQAGTASALGGIKTGDVVPTGFSVVPQPGVAASTDRLPLIVWQGVLEDSGQFVVVHPTIWESDNKPGGNFTMWRQWFFSPNGSAVLQRVAYRDAGAPDITPVWLGEADPSGYPLEPSFDTGQGTDRPIGIENRPGMPNENGLYVSGLVLTRAKVERALGPSRSAILVQGHVGDRLELGGFYRLFYQVERLP